MSWIWTFFLLLSLICACLTNQVSALSSAVLDGSGQAVRLILSLAGPLCLWSGLTRVISDIGLTEGLSRLLSPLLARLFPRAWSNSSAREALCGNLCANLLGLGNAATPLGIQAARQMADGTDTASDELCRLVVLNTASLQLLPTTVAAVRASQGAAAPFDILPAVWLTSLCAVTVGLLAAKGLSRWL